MSIYTYFIEKWVLRKEDIYKKNFIICKKYLILILLPIILITNKNVYLKHFQNGFLRI